MNNKKMLYILIGSSVLMFISIFSMSYKILGVGLLQWVVVVFLSFYSVWKGKFTLADMARYNDAEFEKSWSDKKYFRSGVYLSVIPLMGVGLIMVATIIVCMLFVF